MKLTFELDNPDKLEAELTIKMTVGEFKIFKNQLVDTYPAWKIGNAIVELIANAQKTFENKVDLTPKE